MLSPRKPGLPKLTKQNMEDAPEDKWVDSIKSTVNVAIQEIEFMRTEGRGIKLLGNADVEMAVIDVQVPDPWITIGATGAPAFENGWTEEGATKFYKGNDGVVEFRFVMSGGPGTAWTMPVGYRPDSQLSFHLYDDGTTNNGETSINTSGHVAPTLNSGVVRGQGRYLASDATPIPLSCWPKLVKTKFKTVAGVVVCGVEDAATSKPLPAGAIHPPEWESSSQGEFNQVKLLNIAGLPYNRKCLVKLLIFGG